MLTFEQFQATARHVDSLKEASDYIYVEHDRGGFIYENGVYIEDTDIPNFHYLMIYNEDWQTSDLEFLERKLYQFWLDECQP